MLKKPLDTYAKYANFQQCCEKGVIPITKDTVYQYFFH